MLLSSKEKTKYRRSVQFKAIRKQLLEKADNRCQCCSVKKSKKNLQCHHIDETKYRENDEINYVIVLCSECHSFIEKKIRVIKNKKNPVPDSLLLFLSAYSIDAKKILNDREKEK